ncbi:uncharacterized protein LOC6041154 isoform X2 [Culex quinquefasciatus]|uniref:uncharacterized protein LOC6041154 isoform X2 n=1 Tax=Culex quinquefasciatus TaxID=7176 RepID=UPI0018E2F971|nr:uncharacterized protein LOC6041154 isoform X2 [Culex quinquefasciatus]
MAQQQQQELQPHQPQLTRDHNRGVAGGIAGHSEKRKHRALECESDEDDFAGFDEDATASGSENGVLNSPRSITSLSGASLKKARESQLGGGTLPEDGIGGESPLGAGKQDDMESLLAAGGGGAGAGGMYADPTSKMAMLAAKQQRKPIAPVNPNDEAFKVPFTFGWKRELVYRAHMDGNSKDKGEVYYITPAGKKLRTRNDIVMALHDGLTMDNFTFIKDPVGGSPDEEIIRSAKTYGSTPRRSMSSSTAAAAAAAVVVEPPVEIGKRVPKPKMPKGASPPPFGRASLGQQRTPPSSRSNSQTSPKSGATAQVASRASLGLGGSAVGLKPNENSFGGGALKSAKLKNKTDEVRKSNTSKSMNNIGQSNNRNSSSSFIAADLAAIRTNDTGAAARSSSLAAGLEQNRLFASNFFSNVSIGYDVLQQTFQYLKVQELLRASCVCRMWNQVANHPRLWRTVRMKNSHVNDWAGLARTLHKNGTKHLDLRKMLISGNSDEMWQSFGENIAYADRLERIDLCRCSSTVVGSLLRSNPHLKVINALAIKNDPVDFSNFEHGRSLEELRLKSSAPVSVDGDLSQLGYMTSLRHLSLTSILKLGSTSIEALGELENLESLELGECTEIGQNLADILPNLTKLQRLRLEKGQEAFNMFTVLEGISKVPSLSQLELINCDVKVGFDKHLHRCTNIKKLLLIPTYVSQSAATNHMVLSGVAKLKDTLESFIWTVTVELLRVTELYIDQCDTKNRDDKNSPGESIPILKPVPGVEEIPPANSANPSDTPAQVEIVPLVTVTSILDRSVPNTKVKILKIPFASTWKQGMIDLP